MGNAKFQVTIKNIDENALGPILGSLPNNVAPEIMRMHGRTTSKLAPKVEPSETLLGLEAWINHMPKMPQKFRARDLMKVIKHYGGNPNSISHHIRRATEQKLIRKVAGTAGTATEYERL